MPPFETDYSSDGASGPEGGPEEIDLSISEEDDNFEEYAPQREAVIVFLDVDSFEVQVRGKYEGISPAILKEEPFVVVNEHNVITAVNYPAKALGIKRSKECTLSKAKQMCPYLKELRIPNHYGKPDALTPKIASDDIYESLVRSLQKVCNGRPLPKIEKASKDEFYIDVTDEVFYRVCHLNLKVPTHAEVNVLKQERCFLEAPSYRAAKEQLSFRTLQVLTNPKIVEDRHVTEAVLMHGAVIAHAIVKGILLDTDFTVSAGISTNKLLAKLGCGHNKPDAITVLPQASLGRVAKKIKIKDIPSLGGKLGKEVMDKLKIEHMDQLGHKDRLELIKKFRSEHALKMHQLAVGYDPSKVVAKKFCNSLTCGLTFNYRTRRMGKPEHFLFNLRNRFLEMREHISYECSRHGLARTPKSFKVEIKTRKGDLKSAFGETEDLSVDLRGTVAREAEMYKQGAVTEDDEDLPEAWENLYLHFLGRLAQECKISVLDGDYKAACTAIRKVSAINLVATFLPMAGDED